MEWRIKTEEGEIYYTKTKNIIICTKFFSLIVTACSTKNKQLENTDTRKIGPQADGSFLVPSNQLLRPEGFLNEKQSNSYN